MELDLHRWMVSAQEEVIQIERVKKQRALQLKRIAENSNQALKNKIDKIEKFMKIRMVTIKVMDEIINRIKEEC